MSSCQRSCLSSWHLYDMPSSKFIFWVHFSSAHLDHYNYFLHVIRCLRETTLGIVKCYFGYIFFGLTLVFLLFFLVILSLPRRQTNYISCSSAETELRAINFDITGDLARVIYLRILVFLPLHRLLICQTVDVHYCVWSCETWVYQAYYYACLHALSCAQSGGCTILYEFLQEGPD
jgi:hypothetical protein